MSLIDLALDLYLTVGAAMVGAILADWPRDLGAGRHRR